MLRSSYSGLQRSAVSALRGRIAHGIDHPGWALHVPCDRGPAGQYRQNTRRAGKSPCPHLPAYHSSFRSACTALVSFVGTPVDAALSCVLDPHRLIASQSRR